MEFNMHSIYTDKMATFRFARCKHTSINSCYFPLSGVINELITAMLEIDLSLTQHEIDGKIT
jgi:hypothetical protein